jgi:uncharacterized membrane protein YcjF (UPF0283 family)
MPAVTASNFVHIYHKYNCLADICIIIINLMLTPQEERFIEYWQQNRDREKKLFRQLLIGLPAGLLLAIGIVASVVTRQWYQQADMIANSELNPNVLIIAILAIVVFIAIFYKKFQWDQKEQLYKELLSKKRKEKKDNAEQE